MSWTLAVGIASGMSIMGVNLLAVSISMAWIMNVELYTHVGALEASQFVPKFVWTVVSGSFEELRRVILMKFHSVSDSRLSSIFSLRLRERALPG